MTFVSELVEPWEPNRVAVLFSLVLGGHLWWLPLGLGCFRRQMQQGPVSGQEVGSPILSHFAFYIWGSFSRCESGQGGAVGLDCGYCWPLGFKEEDSKNE